VGQNAYGELAHGDTLERHVFTLVEACSQLPSPVVQVAAGNEHTLILTECGDLYSSGYNEIASQGTPLAGGQTNAVSAVAVSGGAASGNNNVVSSQQQVSAKTGQLRLIEKLRGKNIVRVFASNGCEHAIALTSKDRKVHHLKIMAKCTLLVST